MALSSNSELSRFDKEKSNVKDSRIYLKEAIRIPKIYNDYDTS